MRKLMIWMGFAADCRKRLAAGCEFPQLFVYFFYAYLCFRGNA